MLRKHLCLLRERGGPLPQVLPTCPESVNAAKQECLRRLSDVVTFARLNYQIFFLGSNLDLAVESAGIGSSV